MRQRDRSFAVAWCGCVVATAVSGRQPAAARAGRLRVAVEPAAIRILDGIEGAWRGGTDP